MAVAAARLSIRIFRRAARAAASTGATKTSILPPQASPTDHAVSSATPKWSSRGSRVASTCCAASATAPSTQPPLTDPAIRPAELTAILEPRPRGAEPQVAATVARATSSPAASHSSIS